MRPEPQVFELTFLALPSFIEISLLWHDDRLVLYRGDEELEFKPGEHEWQRFWVLLDRLGVWSWQPKYEDRNVLDGEQWSLVLQYADKSLSCSGNNAYPPGFAELRLAVNSLIGMQLFAWPAGL